MKYAVIDTESSGLFDYNLPADAPGQPRMANLALIALYGDLDIRSALNLYVYPDGWTMPPEGTKVNGLTDEILKAKGRPIKEVLVEYVRVLDEGYVIVGHNCSYDLKIARGELRRAGMADRYETTRSFCTMKALTPICQIPSKRGWKWPTLTEACEHFKIPQPHVHSALWDALNTVELLRRLAEMKMLPEAAEEAKS